eukprot:5719596-Karenia_brevis.AAC.1
MQNVIVDGQCRIPKGFYRVRWTKGHAWERDEDISSKPWHIQRDAWGNHCADRLADAGSALGPITRNDVLMHRAWMRHV